MGGALHSKVWPENKTFESSQMGYLRPEAATVCCRIMKKKPGKDLYEAQTKRKPLKENLRVMNTCLIIFRA